MPNASASSFMDAIGGDEPSLTASAIVAPCAVSGSHILRIDGYSRTVGLGWGNYISSETFTVGGHRWYLRYYADGLGYNLGFQSQKLDWISFTVHCDLTDIDQVKARATISLLDRHGNRVPSHSTTSAFSLRPGEPDAPALPLIKRKALEGSGNLKDDVFSVRCDISVTKIFTKTFPVSEVGRGVMEK